VPKEVGFHSKPQLAADMVRRLHESRTLPFRYPYSATSQGTLKLPSVQRRCAIADTSLLSCHHREFDTLG
jgi:hypothetical protein